MVPIKITNRMYKSIMDIILNSELTTNEPNSDGIPESANIRAYIWAAIIKNEIAVQFGKGEDNKAEQLLSLAVQEGYEPSQKQKVEPMTLKALFRERIEAGLDMPSDFFNTFVKDQTKISRKSWNKEKKPWTK